MKIKIEKLGYAVPVILVMAIAIYMFLTRNDMSGSMKNDLEEQFEGKVDSLFQDDRDHNIKKAVIGSRYVYSMPRKWEGIIEVGDSLVKKKNTLELSVYRQGQLKRVLNYRDTYKKE
ncbi:hypothetical protein [Pedobacter frigiditerrae]|uniref:hypothetical protein n=1 Tax=Pedobacter frigiditerrae TaxID=2530452 RepID=UPI002930E40E|nr:hypothetical protein [Pedobacter frigiditerrae]